MGFRESDLRGSINNPNKPPADAKPADATKDAPKPDASNAKPSDGKHATGGVQPPAPPIPAAPAASTDPDEPPKEAVADYQLLRALDLIRGISLYSNRAN
jgi:carboxyl-terminal processing protease